MDRAENSKGSMAYKPRWPLNQAKEVAEQLQGLLAPACERIVIAGSIRREKPAVGDIEILYIPKLHSQPADMLGFVDIQDELDSLIKASRCVVPRPNKKGAYTYGPKNKLMLHPDTGIPVDIFSTDTHNWGMALVVRTGSAEFNIRLMARFKQQGFAGHAYGGITTPNGEIECPDEETVFRVAGWQYVPPKERIS